MKIEPPTPISTRASIIVDTHLIPLILSVLFIALSVLTIRETLICVRSRDVKADNTRFATHKNRAAAAPLVASANARCSHTQQQCDEALGLLCKRPCNVYMARAASIEVSSLGRLPTDPLW